MSDDGRSRKEGGVEEVDPPLSPIVGYQINSDGENSASSSGTDSETEQNLAKANAELAKIVGTLHPNPDEPDSPKSALRKRRRRRHCRKMNKDLEESKSISTKRQKVELDENESVQISTNEVTPEEEAFQDSIPPEFFDEGAFKENEEALEKESSSPEVTEVSPPFFGFRTAGGKEVNISEHAILQAKALFGDIDASKVTITTPAKLPPENPIPEKPSQEVPQVPTPVKRSKKFKVPLKLKENVPEREEIRKSLNSSCPSDTGHDDTGMTQEVIDCIEALFADEEEFS